MDQKSKSPSNVEHIEFSPGAETKSTEGKHDGTVQLTCDEGVILIPTPSQDPRDPLNIALWHKLMILSCTCLYSTMGLTSVSGLGGILAYFIPEYSAQGKSYDDINPSLFMGIGNMISMPLALAVGRRPVFLVSCIVQVVSLVCCATNTGYTGHFTARCILGLAAGQSSYLPLLFDAYFVSKEIFFLHERARYQQFFSSIQTVISGTLIITTSYIVSTIGWRAWYYLFAGLSSVILIMAIFLVPETKYVRPLTAYKGTANENDNTRNLVPGSDPENPKQFRQIMTVNDQRILDTVNYLPRTLRSDMRLFINKADWREAFYCLKHMFQVFLFPNVFWVVSMNGIFLGVNIAMGVTYGNILSGAFNWADKYISIAQAGQVVVAFVCVPMLGYGSDIIVKFLARRNNGVHEPEHRLLTLIIPLLLGIIFVVIYGQAAAFPERYHWMAIVFCLNGSYYSLLSDYFTFIGANMAGITYLLDAYPTRPASSLVVLCAMRGVISFCLSYGTVSLYSNYGYDGAFGLFGGITGIFGVLGVVVYFTGKRIRKFVAPWTAVEVTGKASMG
ncbi:major facilitator superfamily transporter protein [Rutstroemia sp. NJR-2017a BBW]|nr:major facilitator superfamily transporter protein [Rutstroemia sp. NJR-2017a BBW]